MADLVNQAAWVLAAAFVLSIIYELYRSTVKAGTSEHDSMRSFVKNNLAFYIVAWITIGLLFAGFVWAPWVGLAFSVAVVAATILWYSPKILVERAPGVIDWFEDVVFVGLVFVAAAMLLYAILGISLEP